MAWFSILNHFFKASVICGRKRGWWFSSGASCCEGSTVHWSFGIFCIFLDIVDHCCGSVTFWYGSGSCYFHQWPSRWQDGLLLREATFTSFFKIKSYEEVTKQYGRNQKCSSYFFLMVEGSGSVPLTNRSGYGSWKPKNLRIWIRNIA